MAGTLRGNRYGQTKHGTPTDLDQGNDNRRVGDLLRELRINAGLRQQDLAEAINAAGGRQWTSDTVAKAQTGRQRTLSLRELWIVCQVFGVTADEFLGAVFGDVQVPRPAVEQRRLHDEVVKWVDDMPPFHGYAGQREQIEELAARAGVSRNEMCRRLWAAALPAYRAHLDKEGDA